MHYAPDETFEVVCKYVIAYFKISLLNPGLEAAKSLQKTQEEVYESIAFHFIITNTE